jgi:hypothetical protein
MGASRFIIKPQEPDILLELINDVISKNANDELPPPQIPMSGNEVINRKQLVTVIEKLQKKLKELELKNSKKEHWTIS